MLVRTSRRPLAAAQLNFAYTRHFRLNIEQAIFPPCTLFDMREDIKRVIWECAQYSAFRTLLLMSLGHSISEMLKLSDALGPWSDSKRAPHAKKALLTFQRSIGLNQCF